METLHRISQTKKADGILAVSLTEERKDFLHYPSSPISTGTTVFLKKINVELPYSQLSDLNDKRAGAILGYSYCPELDDQVFLKQAERVSTLEQNFHKLMADRLDFIVEVDSVGLYTAKKWILQIKCMLFRVLNFAKAGII